MRSPFLLTLLLVVYSWGQAQAGSIEKVFLEVDEILNGKNGSATAQLVKLKQADLKAWDAIEKLWDDKCHIDRIAKIDSIYFQGCQLEVTNAGTIAGILALGSEPKPKFQDRASVADDLKKSYFSAVEKHTSVFVFDNFAAIKATIENRLKVLK